MGAVTHHAGVQATLSATFVDEWVRAGVTDAVVAPGSRSTPLVLAIAHDGRLRVHVHVDERSAAFTALGLGRATGRPAVVVTTSGTAAVELHPAVVEADLDRVPVICATADRPWELLDVAAPQTVRQRGLYGSAVRFEADVDATDGTTSWAWRSVASRAVAAAVGPPAGPVHLNLRFREPLVGAPGDLPPGRPDGAPWHRAVRRPGGVLRRDWGARRGVVVAGAGTPPGVVALARRAGWPVLADPRSGWRDADAVCLFDPLLRAGVAADQPPDLIVTAGGPPASRVTGEWVRDLARAGVTHVVVDPEGRWPDPHRTAAVVADDLGGTAEVVDGWAERWREADRRARAAVGATLAAESRLTEPAVAAATLEAVPDGGALVVASSMPVRDLEWWTPPREGVRVHANRGANGIDGVTSTAVGVALAGVPTAALVGDVAFVHDTNALVALRDRPAVLTVVVVDNGGGGIFGFLPQARTVDPGVFERCFTTPHGTDLCGLAAAHGLEADEVDSVEGLRAALSGAGDRTRVVVARCDPALTVPVHQRLHEAVAAAISDLRR